MLENPDEKSKVGKGKGIDADTQRLIDQASRRGDAAKDLGGTVFENTEQEQIEDILDQEFALVEAKIAKGRFGEYVIMHLIYPDSGKHISVATGGAVVVRKVQELLEKRQIPSMVTVVKVKDYYDLV